MPIKNVAAARSIGGRISLSNRGGIVAGEFNRILGQIRLSRYPVGSTGVSGHDTTRTETAAIDDLAWVGDHAVCDCAGQSCALGWLERPLYDYRARDCQWFTPPPSDRIVHLDIDDPTLAEIGAFPWPRTDFAEMVDEIHLAGAKVLGMDIIFAEAQKRRWIEPDEDGKPRSVDDDRNFADAIRRADNVLLPLSLNIGRAQHTQVYVETMDLLAKNLELDENEIIAKLHGSPVDSPTLGAEVRDAFVRARRRDVSPHRRTA